MLLIHPNTATLTKLAAETSRRGLAMEAIRVQATESGYRVEATNGRFGAFVDGRNVDDPSTFPEIPAMTTAPNGATEALIPAREYEQACKSAPKKMTVRALTGVAVSLGKDQTTLATATYDSNLIRQPRNVAGRFPSLPDVFPKDAPRVVIRINPTLLARLLTVAAEFSDTTTPWVDLEVRDKDVPVVIRTRNQDQEFSGLLMPIN